MILLNLWNDNDSIFDGVYVFFQKCSFFYDQFHPVIDGKKWPGENSFHVSRI